MLAVGVVIADHLFRWPSGGFVGVDVFFVISGYLITGLLLREWDRSGTISFWGFYRRRIKRIMPAALLVVFATVIAAYFTFSTVRFARTVDDGVWATFFAANWNFAVAGTDYFAADNAVSPLQHYWSLAVEEQFYLVWPWLMLLIFWIVGRRLKGAPAVKRAARRSVFVAIAILTAASFAWALYESSANPTVAYFSTFSRAWEMGVGALLACTTSAFRRIPDVLRPLLAWFGIAGIIVSTLVITGASTFPAPAAALPVLSTALVIIAGSGTNQTRFLWPLTNPVSRYVGDISYSLYLWHFPAIIFAGQIFQPGAKRYYALALAITAAGAVASYHFVENPIRRSAWLEPNVIPRRRTQIVSIGGTTVAGGLVLTLVGFALSSASVNGSSQTDHLSGPLPETTHEQLQRSLAGASNTDTWPEFTPPETAVVEERPATADLYGCESDASRSVAKDCDAITPSDPTRTVIVVGHSTAAAYLPTIRAIYDRAGWEVVSLVLAACPFVEGLTTADAPGCEEHKQEVIKTINRIEPAVVIDSSMYRDFFQEPAGKAGYATLPEQRVGAHSAIIDLVADSVGTYVVLASPPKTKDIAVCRTPGSSPSDCAAPVPEFWIKASSLQSDQLENHTNRVFIDTLDWFCVDNVCPAFAGDTLMKRDAIHLSEAYAYSLSPLLYAKLNEIGIAPGLTSDDALE
ncbi:acyltransferase [Microbacterium faecale]|uniref:Acyltransferase n=2 Tax=Microbacterium faecale TaxID=1804630 RepID=A0A916Y5X8_9MICO|nr:acyltransferase [Microbacterium faecale]